MSIYWYLAVLPLSVFSLASVVFAAIYKWYLNSHHGDVQAEVTLVMAMTGESDSFEPLLGRLNAQLLKPARLIISVESVADPAYATIQQHRWLASFPVEITIAGLASISSQKCHNLVSALEWFSQKWLSEKNGSTNYVVLCDADIQPPAWWLSALVKPLVNQQADLVTGYRWQQAQNNDFGSNLVVFLDRKIAVLPRPLSAELIWGGSVAINQAVLQAVLKSGLLLNTLSDDLSLASYAAQQNFRVLSRRLLLVPSGAPDSLVQAWAFAVRQYKIMKVYRPLLWCAALVVAVLKVIGWVVLLYLASFTPTLFVFALLLLALSLIQVRIEKTITEYLGFVESQQRWIYQYCLAISKPFIDSVHCLIILMSMFTHLIRWGHVSYEVHGSHCITALHTRGPR